MDHHLRFFVTFAALCCAALLFTVGCCLPWLLSRLPCGLLRCSWLLFRACFRLFDCVYLFKCNAFFQLQKFSRNDVVAESCFNFGIIQRRIDMIHRHTKLRVNIDKTRNRTMNWIQFREFDVGSVICPREEIHASGVSVPKPELSKFLLILVNNLTCNHVYKMFVIFKICGLMSRIVSRRNNFNNNPETI